MFGKKQREIVPIRYEYRYSYFTGAMASISDLLKAGRPMGEIYAEWLSGLGYEGWHVISQHFGSGPQGREIRVLLERVVEHTDN